MSGAVAVLDSPLSSWKGLSSPDTAAQGSGRGILKPHECGTWGRGSVLGELLDLMIPKGFSNLKDSRIYDFAAYGTRIIIWDLEQGPVWPLAKGDIPARHSGPAVLMSPLAATPTATDKLTWGTESPDSLLGIIFSAKTGFEGSKTAGTQFCPSQLGLSI